MELEEEGRHIRIRFQDHRPSFPEEHGPLSPVSRAAAPLGPAGTGGSARPPEEVPQAAQGTTILPSPLVGTFYRAPAPGAEPFVRPGDKVRPGATLCIVEAMKVMNEIKAEAEVEVVEILVKNEEPVEYGQPLFILKPL
jgi:acetyl-CoA carboxylase biotin carboxyl carrier protein